MRACEVWNGTLLSRKCCDGSDSQINLRTSCGMQKARMFPSAPVRSLCKRHSQIEVGTEGRAVVLIPLDLYGSGGLLAPWHQDLNPYGV